MKKYLLIVIITLLSVFSSAQCTTGTPGTNCTGPLIVPPQSGNTAQSAITLVDLALPVPDHGGRTHEEDGRGGTLLPVARDERKGRDALAKPHVVGETRAKAKA